MTSDFLAQAGFSRIAATARGKPHPRPRIYFRVDFALIRRCCPSPSHGNRVIRGLRRSARRGEDAEGAASGVVQESRALR